MIDITPFSEENLSWFETLSFYVRMVLMWVVELAEMFVSFDVERLLFDLMPVLYMFS